MSETALPAHIGWGYVRGRVIQSVADTAEDPDEFPQARPLAGTVVFTSDVPVTFGSPDQAGNAGYADLVFHDPITANLSSSGRLMDAEGRQGLWLPEGSWEVEVRPTGGGRSMKGRFTVDPELHTAQSPLQLAAAFPFVPPTTSTVRTLVVPDGGIGKVLSRDVAGQLVWIDQATGGGTTYDDAPLTQRVATEEQTRADADAALAGRVTTLEGAPAPTPEAIGAQPAGDYATGPQLTAEATARADADAALAGRVTTLEDAPGQDLSGYVQTTDERLSDPRPPTAHDHPASQINDASPVGTAVLTASSATAAREAIGAGTSSLQLGVGATTAAAGDHNHDGRYTRPSDLSTVAMTGAYGDLSGRPTIPSTPAEVGAQPAGDYATAAQGTKADSALQPGALAPYATSAEVDALTAGDVGAKPASYVPTVADIPAGSLLAVHHDGAAWPARPTARTDVTVYWVGSTESDPPPGALDHDIHFARSADPAAPPELTYVGGNATTTSTTTRQLATVDALAGDRILVAIVAGGADPSISVSDDAALSWQMGAQQNTSVAPHGGVRFAVAQVTEDGPVVVSAVRASSGSLMGHVVRLRGYDTVNLSPVGATSGATDPIALAEQAAPSGAVVLRALMLQDNQTINSVTPGTLLGTATATGSTVNRQGALLTGAAATTVDLTGASVWAEARVVVS